MNSILLGPRQGGLKTDHGVMGLATGRSVVMLTSPWWGGGTEASWEWAWMRGGAGWPVVTRIGGLGGRGSADGGGGSCRGVAGLRLRKASCAHGEDCPERCNSVEEERRVLEWEGWASARSVDPSSVIR